MEFPLSPSPVNGPPFQKSVINVFFITLEHGSARSNKVLIFESQEGLFLIVIGPKKSFGAFITVKSRHTVYHNLKCYRAAHSSNVQHDRSTLDVPFF